MSQESKANVATCIAISLGIVVGNVVFRLLAVRHGFLTGVCAGTWASAVACGLVVYLAVKCGIPSKMAANVPNLRNP
jgi:hypothetical protein